MDIFFRSLQESFAASTARRQQLLLLVGATLVVCAVVAVALCLPELIDWTRSYRPAALLLASGQSPYEIDSFTNPPWVLVPLIPLALLPSRLGGAILFVVTLCALVVVAIRVGATPLSLIAFVLSFPVFFMLLFGQIDWLVLVGVFMPPPVGLFFVLAKPQAGIAIAIFWLAEALRKGGFGGAVAEFAPVTLAFGVSIAVYGFWFLDTPSGMVTAKYNFSLWPLSIPIGVTLLVSALRSRKRELSLLASPFLSPYVAPHSWSIALLAILPLQWEAIAASVGSWIMLLMGLAR